MQQLVQPNLTVKGQFGYCLKYAREVFGITATIPTAWEAWQKTAHKHTDAIPGNVSVPLWFSYFEGSKNYGHVVIHVPGKGLYSSPYKTSGQNYAVLPTIAEVERIYKAKYVGWSEDINGVRVVQPSPQGGNSVILTKEAVETLYRRLFGREGDAGGVKNYTGKTLDFALGDMLGSTEFKNRHVKTVEKVVEKVVEKPVIKEVIKEVPTGGVDQETKDNINFIKTTVQWIKDKLSTVFK